MKTLYVLTAIAIAVLADDDVPALKELKRGNLEFSAKTYTELAKSNTGNFLVCPLSVEVVLSLVEAGAGGETAKQLIAGLSLPKTEAEIHEAFKAIAPSLNVDDLYTLTSANKIYLKNGFQIYSNFKDIATNVFQSNIQEIDFTNSNAAPEINKWVSDNTRGKIKDLLSSDDLDGFTRAVLINALYFHGLWINPFYEEATKEKVFHINSKTEVKVKMMEQTERFNYYRDETLKAKFLEMYYYGSPISMTFILPDDIEGLPVLEKNIEKVLEAPKYSFAEVHVQIPHVNIEHKIDFIPILKQFGITDIFESKANLSRIGPNSENLHVSKVIQKTFIAVEEKGTTAAAATAAIAVDYSATIDLDPQPPKEFEANHPFIFSIKSSDGILFVGRYVNPN